MRLIILATILAILSLIQAKRPNIEKAVKLLDKQLALANLIEKPQNMTGYATKVYNAMVDITVNGDQDDASDFEHIGGVIGCM